MRRLEEAALDCRTLSNVPSRRVPDQICKGKSRQVRAIDEKQLAGIAPNVLFKSKAAMLICNSNHCLDAFSVQISRSFVSGSLTDACGIAGSPLTKTTRK
jgi:hypothetical protein